MNRVEMEHAGTRALHEFWVKLRAGRAAPYRAEVTAAGLGAALFAQIAVLEQIGPGDYRIRLAGPELHEVFGLEIRGMSFESLIEHESRRALLSLADEALAQGAVAVARIEGRAPGAPMVEMELILAPLRSDFGRVDRLLAAVHAFGLEESGRIARAPRRCHLLRAALEPAGVADPAEPLPGFAEGAAPFTMDRPSLASFAGDGDGKGERRRDHLRLVKD
ncbi:MAG: PAS domain-containing protein [Pikeienuella sp.]